MIAEWWAPLSPVMKILWAITLSVSLIFIIQTIMTFIGADSGDSGLDADFDSSPDIDPGALDSLEGAGHSGMNLYTFRNFVNFFLGFGWTAILFENKIPSTGLLILISFLVGAGLVAVVMYLFKWLSGMQQSGNINVFRSAIGCHGSVYLRIPAERSGEGKVQISINNSIREYSAVTDGDEIRTGAQIHVVEVLDSHTLLVEEDSSLII